MTYRPQVVTCGRSCLVFDTHFCIWYDAAVQVGATFVSKDQPPDVPHITLYIQLLF